MRAIWRLNVANVSGVAVSVHHFFQSLIVFGKNELCRVSVLLDGIW
jgi:hypothetical protein